MSSRSSPIRPWVILLGLLTGVAAVACGGSEKVGGSENLAFQEQQANRVGAIDATTTTAKAPTTAAPMTAPATTRPASRATATSTITTVATFTVRIVASGQGFDPFNFAVRRGVHVIVQNADSQTRTWTSDRGLWDSGPIAPGATFTWVASQAGTHNFHDETRPFAVGQVEVRE